MANEVKFPVTRGVRQGDMLSPLLFNAALENVISKWKMCLHDHGIKLNDTHRLTNLRYADDLLLFGKSLAEVLEMLEILSAELVGVGLSINGSKTKILTTDLNASSSENPLYVDVAGSMVEILRRGTVHKYLGKVFCGNLRNRGQCNLSHRMQCAWWKFHQLRTTLENKNIPLKLRLKLFDAVVSPTILYSLSTTPLTSAQVEKMDVTQRRMLRKIVGWIRFDDEDWEVIGRRMKTRLEAGLRQYPIKTWSERRANLVQKLLDKIANAPDDDLRKAAFNWNPSVIGEYFDGSHPYRAPGRPRQRWYE